MSEKADGAEEWVAVRKQPRVLWRADLILTFKQMVAAAAGGDWQAVDDGAGKTYYYNGKTGVSQWEKPPGM